MQPIMNKADYPAKLLIVDDNVEIRKLIKLTLDYGVYQIFEAGNGSEALNMILKEKPDIVLLDIMMPGDIDGLEVCDFIKSSTLSDCKAKKMIFKKVLKSAQMVI